MSSESLFTKCNGCKKDISKSAGNCPHCGKRQLGASKLSWVGIAIVSLIIISTLSSIFSGQSDKGASIDQKPPNTASQTPTEKAKNDVKLEYQWAKTGFGSVMEVDFRVVNDSSIGIRDIEIQCDHYANSGTKVDSNNRTIYDIVGAKTSRTFNKFSMGFIHEQAAKTNCFVKKFSAQ
jgi:RNA polymerase subunit RPABC4/transcription elongation factor Spt4